MKTCILIISLFFLQSSLFAQNSEGVKLVNFTSTDCHIEPNIYLVQKRIISQKYVDGILEIEIATWDNCAKNGVGKVHLANDTLKLYNDQSFVPRISEKGDTIDWYREVAECDCCFNFKYKISGLKNIDFIVTTNDVLVQKRENYYVEPEFTIRKGDTLFYSDSQGYEYSYSFYEETGGVKTVKKSKAQHNYWTTYYPTGTLKEIYEFRGSIDNYIWKKFDPSGILIFEEDKMKK